MSLRYEELQNMVDVKTADKYIEDAIITSYPHTLKSEQIHIRSPGKTKSTAKFYCLNKNSIEDFLKKYPKNEYEIYQEPVDLATTSHFLYASIVADIKAFSINNAEDVEVYDISEPPCKNYEDIETIYMVANLDRQMIIPFLKSYKKIHEFEIIHSRTGYRIINTLDFLN